MLTIGIMEYWNDGMMGLDKEMIQIKIDFVPTIYPMFQYSTVPSFHVEAKTLDIP
jgi:hypothetical protein